MIFEKEALAKTAMRFEKPKISEQFGVLSSQVKQRHVELEAVFKAESCKTSIELMLVLTEGNQAHDKLTRNFESKWVMVNVRKKPEKKRVIYIC